MIQPNELRIGNYINLHRYFTDDNKNGIQKFSFDLSDGIKRMTPIPLTEEILLKCGFIKDFIDYKHDYIDIIDWCIPNNGDYKFLFSIDKEINAKDDNIKYFYEETEIKSLHHLQNIYWSITQKELEVKL